MAAHPNGFISISVAPPECAAWNLRRCPACQALMDFRAKKCRSCYLTNDGTKVCTRCREHLPRSSFYKRSNGEILPRCKSCVAAVGRHPTREQKDRYQERLKRPEAKARRNRRLRVRLQTEPYLKLTHCLAAHVRRALKCSIKNAGLTHDTLLGCSAAEFLQHIQVQWKPGMSWSNWGRGRGKWHLDHIFPVSKFDFDKPEHASACFNYRNYQPLWQDENIRKHNKTSGMTVEAAIAFIRH